MNTGGVLFTWFPAALPLAGPVEGNFLSEVVPCADRRLRRGGPLQMDDAQIYSLLAPVFEEVFEDESIKVTPELAAKDVEGWDSLTHIRLILSTEKAFKIKFTNSEITNLENVGALVALIRARV
jgi:acyl carrier protein